MKGQVYMNDLSLKSMNESKTKAFSATIGYSLASLEGGEGFGLKETLENIDLSSLKRVKKKLANFLYEFETDYKGTKTTVGYSLGGGFIFKTPFPKSVPAPLEISAEVFVETDNLQAALESFSNFVYNDIIALANAKDMHLFHSLSFYEFGKNNSHEKVKWDIKQIISDKNKFLGDLITSLRSKKWIILKIFLRSARLESHPVVDDLASGKSMGDKKASIWYFEEEEFDYLHNYVKTYKTYNLHLVSTNIKEIQTVTFEYIPMASLLKRVFISKNIALKYASLQYKDTEPFINSRRYGDFIGIQITLLHKKWISQNLFSLLWELSFLVFYMENYELKTKLMQAINSVFDSLIGRLFSLSKVLYNLNTLMVAYKNSSLKEVKAICSTNFEIVKEEFRIIFANTYDSDILRFKNYLAFCLQKLTSKERSILKISTSNINVVQIMTTQLKCISLSSIQFYSAALKNIQDFIISTLTKNKLLEQSEAEIYSFSKSLAKKEPKLVLFISREVEDAKDKSEFAKMPDAEIELKLLFHYINQYEILEVIYKYMLEIHYGTKINEPLSAILSSLEQAALKFEIFELTRDNIKDLVFNYPDFEHILYYKEKPIDDAFVFVTKQLTDANLPPIVGFERNIHITAENECSGLRSYLSTINWRRFYTEKLPANFKINDLFSISGYNLLQNSAGLKRSYMHWGVTWDFIVKGPDYQTSLQVFLEILVKYSIRVDKFIPEISVMGFYSTEDYNYPFASIKFLKNNFDNSKPQKVLTTAFSRKKRVFLQIIAKIDNKFKVIKLFLNMYWFNPEDSTYYELYEKESIEEYIKVSFSKNEFLYWNQVKSYNEEVILKLLEKREKNLVESGNLFLALKTAYLRSVFRRKENEAILMARMNFSVAEKIYNSSVESDSLIKIIEAVSIHGKDKFRMDMMKELFADYKANIIAVITSYEDIYLEGMQTSIMGLLNYLSHYFSVTSIEDLQKMNNKISYCLKKIRVICFAISYFCFI